MIRILSLLIQILILESVDLAYASEDGYFSEKYHGQMGLRIDYSNLHLQDPEVLNYGTDYNNPSFEILFSTLEGSRVFGFGWGGDLQVDSSNKPTRISFNQLSIDQYLDSSKSGLFFELKGMSYKIDMTDIQSSTSGRTVALAAIGYSRKFNEYFSISAYGGQIFDSIFTKNSEYQLGIYFDSKFTNDVQTNLKQDLSPKGLFFVR